MDVSQILIQKYSKQLTIEGGARLQLHEWLMVEWVLEKLSCDVVVSQTNDDVNVKSADILLGGELFELKQTGGTVGTLDTQVRYAIHQSGGRGVIVNITGDKYTNDVAIMTVMNRMHRTGLSEVYILRDMSLIAHILQNGVEFVIKKTAYHVPMRGAQ